MSNQPQGLRTPQRATFNIFDDEPDNRIQNPCNTFTPCTRLSRMTIESTSNSNGRIRTAHFQLPVTSFNDKLMEVVREEEESTTTHPNLDMFLSADRISMFDKSKDNGLFPFSEDEESDEGDLFSSSLCPMSSPERVLTRQSIFEDEPMHSSPAHTNRKSIFDDDDDDKEDELQQQVEDDDEDRDYYDPSTAWLSQIYQDNSGSSSSSSNSSSTPSTPVQQQQDDDDEENEENRAPRFWNSRQKEQQEKKMRRTLPHEEDNSVNERLPLREIRFEDYLSDDELPAKKKMILGNGKPHKMRFMRTLSPPRYAKRKGKEPAENIMPFSSSYL